MHTLQAAGTQWPRFHRNQTMRGIHYSHQTLGGDLCKLTLLRDSQCDYNRDCSRTPVCWVTKAWSHLHSSDHTCSVYLNVVGVPLYPPCEKSQGRVAPFKCPETCSLKFWLHCTERTKLLKGLGLEHSRKYGSPGCNLAAHARPSRSQPCETAIGKAHCTHQPTYLLPSLSLSALWAWVKQDANFLKWHNSRHNFPSDTLFPLASQHLLYMLHWAAAARGIPRQPFSHNRQVRQACISKCNHCTGRNFKQQRLLRLAPSATVRSRSVPRRQVGTQWWHATTRATLSQCPWWWLAQQASAQMDSSS